MSVSVERLTKRFVSGGPPAIESIAFDAPAGAITSLIGPSGAGKSTVLRIVAGLEFPDTGNVTIQGVDVSRVPARERGVGLVFQNYALFRNMNVRENVGFGLDVRRRPKNEVKARVDELLELVGLRELGERLPSQLSGGQRQRVAFARALAIEPKVLLLDEPFGALDARVRRELREWLRELHERTHVTTLLVTHDQEEALEISEHVVLMFDGRVAQAGPPREIYDRPRSAVVASFLGANIVRGARAGEAVDAYVRPEDVKLRRAASSDESETRTGKIERVRVVGAKVKVALALASGERIAVDMARGEFDALDLSVGDRVHVDVRSAKVFLEDYAI
jgi:sulfate transport system ATP-binding protein